MAVWSVERKAMEIQLSHTPHPPSSQWLRGQHGTQSHLVHFPTPMLRDLDRHAQQLGKGVSWCLRMAWNMAADQLGEVRALQRLAGHQLLAGKKTTRLIELPVALWLSVALEAERLDRSRSWLLQRAWLLARSHFVSE